MIRKWTNSKQGDIFIPRVVSIGYKGSYSDIAFRKSKPTDSTVVTWYDSNPRMVICNGRLLIISRQGNVETIEYDIPEPSKYQQYELMADQIDEAKLIAEHGADYNLSANARSWSDFLRVELGHKNVFELHDFQFTPSCASTQTGLVNQAHNVTIEEYVCFVHLIP
jgi:hypothetical protein